MTELSPSIPQISLRRQRYFELVGIFLVVPALLAVFHAQLGVAIPAILIAAGLACGWYILRRGHSLKCYLCWQKNHQRVLLRRLLFFGLAGAGLCLCIYLWFPSLWLNFPTQRTYLWLTILLVYPLFSVLPQEIIFRAFVFERYRDIFPGRHSLLLLSAGLFAWAHLVFVNWIAVVVSYFGGVIFGYTYLQTRSLLLVSIEHSLWGSLIFTVGLGEFFYSGFIH